MQYYRKRSASESGGRLGGGMSIERRAHPGTQEQGVEADAHNVLP